MYSIGEGNQERQEHPWKTKEESIEMLKRLARKSKEARQRRQYDIVRLSLKGRKTPKIAEIMDMSLQGTYNMLNRYKTNGVEGLILGKVKGRERKLTAEQKSELYEVIFEKLPKDVGLESFCSWTASLACKYVKDRVEFSERGMRDVSRCILSPEIELYPSQLYSGKR